MKKLTDSTFWIFFITVMFGGCMTVDKAKQTLNKNPASAADYCAAKYPVKDSVGDPVLQTKPADNRNYQGTIDSLLEFAGALASKMYADSVAAAERLAANLPTDTAKLAQDVRYYKELTKSLTDQIFKLKSQYKPCKPDTVEIRTPVYKENTAREDALRYQLAEMAAQLKQAQTDRDAFKAKAHKRGWIMWSLMGAIVVATYLRIKGIL